MRLWAHAQSGSGERIESEAFEWRLDGETAGVGRELWIIAPKPGTHEVTVVVTDGRITSVGTAMPADLPADARRLDLPGLTLLPGLIDMHVHLASTPYVSGWNELDYADDFGTILQVGHARANLMAGFTTVRNLGGPDFADVAAVARSIAAHAPERIVWGSNWPHNLARAQADYPDDAALADTVLGWLPNEAARHLALVDNPEELFGIKPSGDR